jgi:hypothetical protein
MPQSPYRQPFVLDTDIKVTVEKEVAELLKVMSETSKIPEGELVNTAIRRYIATHGDYVPKKHKKHRGGV